MEVDQALLMDPPPDFGDPAAEYQAILNSCALIGRADRGALSVTGERRFEMLDGLLTNSLEGLTGTARHAMLLTPKGKVLTDLRVIPRSSDLLLDVPRSGLENLLKALSKYLPPIFAQFDDASASLCQLGIYGPRAAEVAGAIFPDAVPDADLEVREGEHDGAEVLLIRNRWLAGDGVELIVPELILSTLCARLLTTVADHGGRPVGTHALKIAHVEWGVPRYGRDISEENLAQETGLEDRAISFEKGCYLGQEVVARIHFRGHVNRHLRGLKFSETAPEPGASLIEAGKEVGTVTTTVESPELGPIGLGYVRRRIEPANVLHWSDGQREGLATVAELPFRSSAV